MGQLFKYESGEIVWSCAAGVWLMREINRPNGIVGGRMSSDDLLWAHQTSSLRRRLQPTQVLLVCGEHSEPRHCYKTSRISAREGTLKCGLALVLVSGQNSSINHRRIQQYAQESRTTKQQTSSVGHRTDSIDRYGFRLSKVFYFSINRNRYRYEQSINTQETPHIVSHGITKVARHAGAASYSGAPVPCCCVMAWRWWCCAVGVLRVAAGGICVSFSKISGHPTPPSSALHAPPALHRAQSTAY